MKKYLFPLLLISIACYSSFSEKYFLNHRKEYYIKNKSSIRWVISKNGLNMREKPSLKGKVIKALPFSTRVLISLSNKIPVTIGGVKGNWVRVETQHYANGWVFDHYLGSIGKLFATRDGKYGEYRYYKSWQSGFLISITLHKNGDYTFIYQNDTKLVSKLMGRYYMNNKRVILYKPNKVIKAGGRLYLFPMRFRFQVKYDLIALMGKKVNFYKYSNQSY